MVTKKAKTPYYCRVVVAVAEEVVVADLISKQRFQTGFQQHLFVPMLCATVAKALHK